jgi:erythromycin esterase
MGSPHTFTVRRGNRWGPLRAAGLFLPALLAAQSAPSNLAFQSGTPGDPPRGWTVPQFLKSLGFSAEFRKEGCHSAAGCAVLLAPDAPPPDAFGNLMLRFDAARFRGQTVRLRAWVKLQPAGEPDRAPSGQTPRDRTQPDRASRQPAPSNHAQMWLRVDLPNQQIGFFDNMGDRPISSSEWKSYEITGQVAADAQSINIGVMSFGKTPVWIDGVTFEVVSNAASGPEVTAARTAIQKQYARIDSAYAQSDLDAVASLALPDAQIRMGTMKISLSAALLQIMAEMEKGARYVSRSTLTDVRLSGDDAIVSVNNEATRTSSGGVQILISSNRDTWAKTANGWKLKESALISSRSVTPPTAPQTAQPVVAELKLRAIQLVTADPAGADLPASAVPAQPAGGPSRAGAPPTGSPTPPFPADLAAFGKAVGDARIVSLGEASHGTREFFQLKHRLLEYLVKGKGFTVFAIEANWPESLAVDRYIKTGEGSAKAALAGMYFWTWYTEEVVDLIEWMRSYNQAPGQHPILTFTSFDMQAAHVAAQKALDYLMRYAPDDVDAAGQAYTEAQALETRRGQIYDDQAQAIADRAAAVVKLLDQKRAVLTAASSREAWRDARQAAAIVYQSCTMRIPGKGPAYRDEAMAGNVAWLNGQEHPNEKMVLWAHNGHVGFGAGSANGKSMGAWLRERYGKQMYVAGFAFRQGRLRAIGMENGTFTALSDYPVPPSPEGSGDAVLSAAGMPLFFLDMASLPPAGPLARWLAEPHLFHNVGANWVIDDPDSNLDPQALSKLYDGLIFVEESHAAHAIEK